MNALLRRLDVDPVQWRALMRASLRTDLAALQRGQGGTKGGSATILLVLVIYLLAGIGPAAVAAAAADVLLSATVMVTITAFMLASSLLVGEGTTILSPTDHHVLGFRPVTSRTYLAVRIASLLVRTLVICTCVALLPVIVYFANDGFHPARGLAALAAAYGAGVAVTLAIVAMYGWLLRLAGPARMMRWASYVQLAAQFLVWGSFIVVSQDLLEQQLAGVALSGSPWALLYPGAWYGSWVALAAGDAAAQTLAGVGLSLLLIAVLWRTIGGKLALGYAESLGRVAVSAAPMATGAARPSRWLGLLDHESRAVAILVRSHMQHDVKFRLGVISLLPITILYIIMGGWPDDPFAQAAAAAEGDTPLIQIALLFLPMTLRQVLVTSERWRGSWIFHASPADQARLVLASRNIIALFFLIPYLLFIAALFSYAFGSVWHALLHTTFMGLVSYLVLQFTVLVSPQLPFSLPQGKDAQAGRMFGVMMFVVIFGMLAYWALRIFVYGSAAAMAATLLGFVVVSWVMDRLTRRHARARLGAASIAL